MFHLLKASRTLLIAILCALAVPATSQVIQDVPEEMQGVGVDEKRGQQVPLDLEFRHHTGKRMKLQELFDGERPVLLTLNYSDCPMLCKVQLNGLVQTLREMKWLTGEEFDVVSVSIDPRETPERAKLTHQRYVRDYGRPGAAGGWHFLVGDEENITALADAVGFRYNFVEDTGEYAHTAALMVMTPEGVVSRYLYGVMFDPDTVRLSLVEAADGKVGSAMDQILLTCFVYDHTKGRYGPQAFRLMQLGAGATVALLAVSLLPFWLIRRSQHAAAASPQAAGSEVVPAMEPTSPSAR